MQVFPAISAAEGHFIAGFVEGEGHFGITEANGGQSFRYLMSLRVRDDDSELLEWLHARTGVGTLHAIPARAFLCAEGSFSLDRSHTGISVHLRRDDRPLLAMFAQTLGVGGLRDDPAYGSALGPIDPRVLCEPPSPTSGA